MPRRSPNSEFVLRKTDLSHGVPSIANISRGAPGIAANLGPPLPHVIAAVLAKTIEDRPPRFQERVTHLLVNALHFPISINIASPAPVVFQIIDAPSSVGPGILFFVAVAAFVSGTGIWPGRRIDADLQTLAVYVVSESFHIRKFLVGGDIPLPVAARFPGVVKGDLRIARIRHPAGSRGSDQPE